MATEHIATTIRATLAECTQSWSELPISPLDAYVDFEQRLERADIERPYDTYISTAITAGGYRRDSTRSYADVVAMNSDYALSVTDELHRLKQLNVHEVLDAVALGKVQGWKQRDYLAFFFHAMLRPVVDSKNSPEYRALKDDYEHPQSYDPLVFNDETLPNEARFPHYQAFTDEYWQRIAKLDIAPIDQMVRVSDWSRSLGGRAEEKLARAVGIRVATPQIYMTTRDFMSLDITPHLKAHMASLSQLGADLFVPPVSPQLILVDSE